MRNITRYKSLILAGLLSLTLTPSAARAADSPEGRERTLTVQSSQQSAKRTEWKKVKIKVIPTIEYWEKVAVCESSSDGEKANWRNGGTWAGGLGIYTKGTFGDPDMGTWERWGGEEFAPSPDKATKAEQIIVANRIAVLGWKTTIYRDPEMSKIQGIPAVYEYNKKPVGFGGWGCIKSKSTGKWRIGLPKNWKKDNYVYLPADKSMYCPKYEPLFEAYQLPVKLFSYIAWRESRCQPKAIGWNYRAGMNHLSCKEVTPSCKAVKSYDSGLLQINSSWRTLTSQICRSKLGDLTVLKQPECNVKVAHYLFANTSGRLKNWSINLH
jgi:hypothetical protein